MRSLSIFAALLITSPALANDPNCGRESTVHLEANLKSRIVSDGDWSLFRTVARYRKEKSLDILPGQLGCSNENASIRNLLADPGTRRLIGTRQVARRYVETGWIAIIATNPSSFGREGRIIAARNKGFIRRHGAEVRRLIRE